jgi:hypothetical protein
MFETLNCEISDNASKWISKPSLAAAIRRNVDFAISANGGAEKTLCDKMTRPQTRPANSLGMPQSSRSLGHRQARVVAMEFEEAARLYRRKMTEGDRLFRLGPPPPSAALSHQDDKAWYLRDTEGRLIARVSSSGVRLA